ncbi:hypothetical protein EMIHUDRAFT_231338 [Emiliania huxleyi CCMP1516]|uniref:Uncharacterized protein n=2 Tax=Emiliania huxleyi TaxID=2903 RepID=A0A0D3K7Z9_EMIH1|nr:hypothetical protein EMIHUDRAFT_231338 [Emiliania huxleyi CCMP1516]EOD31884.1 hypothetical protein EMIHUDRAFT_231338 [Emiliania huxleyi CCMP1516]|eukprot:XP_005784313.1 hypothetical protein EMIHUDRAFT_231338 [Emiliania huxleyi CCMP1516]
MSACSNRARPSTGKHTPRLGHTTGIASIVFDKHICVKKVRVIELGAGGERLQRPAALGRVRLLHEDERGESFRETYWAWYNLSARAAIGNAAYAAGVAATAKASASEAADAPLLGAAVDELALDDETVAEAIAALDGGDGVPGCGDDADEDAGG